jgi:hypothetical protein
VRRMRERNCCHAADSVVAAVGLLEDIVRPHRYSAADQRTVESRVDWPLGCTMRSLVPAERRIARALGDGAVPAHILLQEAAVMAVGAVLGSTSGLHSSSP